MPVRHVVRHPVRHGVRHVMRPLVDGGHVFTSLPFHMNALSAVSPVRLPRQAHGGQEGGQKKANDASGLNSSVCCPSSILEKRRMVRKNAVLKEYARVGRTADTFQNLRTPGHD